MKGNGSGSGTGNGEFQNLELPMLTLPGAHPCEDCGACCTYVGVELDRPTTPGDYDHVHWYLTHHGVSVYIDWEGDWYVEFASTCQHLTPTKTCGIYRDRPELCADFSWETCEKTTREPGYRERFSSPEDFFRWFEEKRPKSFERYVKFRRDRIRQRERRARAARASVARTAGTGAGQSSTSI